MPKFLNTRRRHGRLIFIHSPWPLRHNRSNALPTCVDPHLASALPYHLMTPPPIGQGTSGEKMKATRTRREGGLRTVACGSEIRGFGGICEFRESGMGGRKRTRGVRGVGSTPGRSSMTHEISAPAPSPRGWVKYWCYNYATTTIIAVITNWLGGSKKVFSLPSRWVPRNVRKDGIQRAWAGSRAGGLRLHEVKLPPMTEIEAPSAKHAEDRDFGGGRLCRWILAYSSLFRECSFLTKDHQPSSTWGDPLRDAKGYIDRGLGKRLQVPVTEKKKLCGETRWKQELRSLIGKAEKRISRSKCRTVMSTIQGSDPVGIQCLEMGGDIPTGQGMILTEVRLNAKGSSGQVKRQGDVQAGWRAEIGWISAKGPPGQVKRRGNIQAGEQAWIGSVQKSTWASRGAGRHTNWRVKMVGSAQRVHLDRSRGRTTYILESKKWVGSAQNVHLGRSSSRTTYTLERENRWDRHKGSAWENQEAGDIHTREQKWVGSAQKVHLGKSRGRVTYRLESSNGSYQCKRST
ncbi:hypothetical protein FA13DRAFT_1709456 [Coprinellus micaceus]|uniref:Uncharacterized protein n=1 Tax=Coprinellus micaceus TaxID=71717 RepID=A0A4Y7TCW5_COPMI|nr:hypothetical protein FA13DRAFT_1709456 [Coprinellus micaceus]